jgi:hypothetical protein
VAKANGCAVYTTNSFWTDGAHFNKWKALEEGLDFAGRSGWLCLLDPDVAWPKGVRAAERLDLLTLSYDSWNETYTPNVLIAPLRRMCVDLGPVYVNNALPPESEWCGYRQHPQQHEHAGFSQVFHASDSTLGKPPWHEVDWKHAGGADSFFQAKWPKEMRRRPCFEVLHLGPAGVNWCGRATPYLDGSMPEESEERYGALRDMVKRRGAGPTRFAAEKLAPRTGQ